MRRCDQQAKLGLVTGWHTEDPLAAVVRCGRTALRCRMQAHSPTQGSTGMGQHCSDNLACMGVGRGCTDEQAHLCTALCPHWMQVLSPREDGLDAPAGLHGDRYHCPNARIGDE
ncbi:hypothetical protein B0H10DRAFT_2239529 [Mycena sp. CBHHK59/15]|nr:hypothetical protein B0H10DRAFT_2239529 [Mycena sp. CBHHK59/15]